MRSPLGCLGSGGLIAIGRTERLGRRERLEEVVEKLRSNMKGLVTGCRKGFA